MTQSPTVQLRGIAPFSRFQADSLARVEQNARLVRYTIGQPLTDGQVLPAEL